MLQVSDLMQYIVWLGVLGVAALVIGVVAARLLRKRLQTEPRTDAFSLNDLRRMRAEGSITQEEYEAMRAAIIARLDAGSAPASPGSPGPRAASDAEIHDGAEGPAADSADDD